MSSCDMHDCRLVSRQQVGVPTLLLLVAGTSRHAVRCVCLWEGVPFVCFIFYYFTFVNALLCTYVELWMRVKTINYTSSRMENMLAVLVMCIVIVRSALRDRVPPDTQPDMFLF